MNNEELQEFLAELAVVVPAALDAAKDHQFYFDVNIDIGGLIININGAIGVSRIEEEA